MHYLDISIIVFFFIGISFYGIFQSTKNKSLQDFFLAAIIENIPIPPNMLITISSSLTKFDILSLSVDNLGEKNTFSTSTINRQPLSLYSVSVLSLPAKISRFLVRKSRDFPKFRKVDDLPGALKKIP